MDDASQLKAELKAGERIKSIFQPCPGGGFVTLDAMSHQVPPTPLPEHASDGSIAPALGGDGIVKEGTQTEAPRTNHMNAATLRSIDLESHAELKARCDHAKRSYNTDPNPNPNSDPNHNPSPN